MNYRGIWTAVIKFYQKRKKKKSIFFREKIHDVSPWCQKLISTGLLIDIKVGYKTGGLVVASRDFLSFSGDSKKKRKIVYFFYGINNCPMPNLTSDSESTWLN